MGLKHTIHALESQYAKRNQPPQTKEAKFQALLEGAKQLQSQHEKEKQLLQSYKQAKINASAELFNDLSADDQKLISTSFKNQVKDLLSNAFQKLFYKLINKEDRQKQKIEKNLAVAHTNLNLQNSRLESLQVELASLTPLDDTEETTADGSDANSTAPKKRSAEAIQADIDHANATISQLETSITDYKALIKPHSDKSTQLNQILEKIQKKRTEINCKPEFKDIPKNLTLIRSFFKRALKNLTLNLELFSNSFEDGINKFERSFTETQNKIDEISEKMPSPPIMPYSNYGGYGWGNMTHFAGYGGFGYGGGVGSYAGFGGGCGDSGGGGAGC